MWIPAMPWSSFSVQEKTVGKKEEKKVINWAVDIPGAHF